MSGPRLRGAVVTRVYFEIDQHVLRPGSRRGLARFARAARAVGVRELRLTGYTDAWNTWAYNRQLSVRRALTVQQFLQARLPGVDVQVDWRSEGSPDAPNEPDTRWRNRRVTVRVVG